ncbi:MAG: aminopeptidase, partial [Actinobacteria bacterium]
MPRRNDYVPSLAELLVRFGANVQSGQIVALSSEPGKEPLARAVAEAAYRAGARFVDLQVFDVHLKRSRALYADPDSLGFVPPWYGDRMRALGDARAARIVLSGPVAPRIMD